MKEDKITKEMFHRDFQKTALAMIATGIEKEDASPTPIGPPVLPDPKPCD